MNKKQVEQLNYELAEGKIDHDCAEWDFKLDEPVYPHKCKCKKDCNPVTIRRGFKLMQDNCTIGDNEKNMPRLIELWLPCGIDKSLQEIVDKSGYEKKCGFCDGKMFKGSCPKFSEQLQHKLMQRLKDPAARKLFTFIDQLQLFN